MSDHGVQVFRLQLVDADDNVICRFAGGGNVEIDLVRQCVREIQATWVPPDVTFRSAVDRHLTSFMGVTTRRRASDAGSAALAEWRATNENDTDFAIAKAIVAVMNHLKQNAVSVLSDRMNHR